MLKRAISWLYWNWVIKEYGYNRYSEGCVVEVTGLLRLDKDCDTSVLHFSSNNHYIVKSSEVKLIRRKGELV